MRLPNFVFLLMCVYAGLPLYAMAQDSVSFYRDLYPVVKSKCSICHNPGNTNAPFVLETYNDFKVRISTIKYVVETRKMPPWKADNAYQCYANNLELTAKELLMFKAWFEAGAPEGDKPVVDAHDKRVVEKTPDLVIKVPAKFKIKESTQDQYFTYSTKLQMKEDQVVQRIELEPSNKRVVHHLRVDLDTADLFGTLESKQGVIQTADMNSVPGNLASPFFSDYVPGVGAANFPPGTGKKLYKKCKILFNVHYSPTTKQELSGFKMNLFFAPNTHDTREVMSICDRYIPADKNNFIPKDSVFTLVYNSSPTLYDLSLISIQGHMHLLGKSQTIFAVTPSNDTIPLLHIPAWDFNWQLIYKFCHLIKLPKGSRFVSVSVFDNTSLNPSNPFSPPRNVRLLAMRTTDEMSEYYLNVMMYQEGDEKIQQEGGKP